MDQYKYCNENDITITLQLPMEGNSVKSKLIKDDIAEIASDIFSGWDRSHEGVVFSDDICNALGVEDSEFAFALANILGSDNSGKIYPENLESCLRILIRGDVASKVSLFLNFMNGDRDSSGCLTFDTVYSHLQISDPKIFERLGVVDCNGMKKALEYKDILTLFEKSERGHDAIDVFCNQILRILTKRAMRKKTRSMFLPPIEVAQTRDHNISGLIHKVKTTVMSRFYVFFLVTLQVLLFLYNVHHYHLEGNPVSFCIAKGFGLNLRVLTLVLFLSMARSTLSMLNNIKLLRPFLFIGYNIELHSMAGFCTVFHTFGHIIFHIIYQMAFRKDGFSQSFKQKSLLRLIFTGNWSEYNFDVLSGDAITGFVLVFIILVMASTALGRSHNSVLYKVFSNIHFLYLLWLVMVVLHVPTLWPYFLAVALLMFCDRAYDLFLLTTHSTLAHSRPCSSGVTFLSVPYSQYSGYPGSYYRIKVPAISAVEWHPFSLAGSKTSHHLTFFVASAGDWTSKLFDIVSNAHLRRQTKVLVQGPFYAPAKEALLRPTSSVLLVASGIGITPFFSVMATKVTDEYVHESDRGLYEDLFEDGLDDRGASSSTLDSLLLLDTSHSGRAGGSRDSDVQKLQVVWVLRDAVELMFYLDYVYHLVKHQKHLRHPVVEVHVYLTGLGQKTDPAYLVAQTLFLLSVSGHLSDYMTIKFGRPKLKKIIESVRPDEVYYCGGKHLKDTLESICFDEKISFVSESFDAGESKVWKYLSSLVSPSKVKSQSFMHDGVKRFDSMSSGYTYDKKKSSIW
jgi:hypothetical protein